MRDVRHDLHTHVVHNQPADYEAVNFFDSDPILSAWFPENPSLLTFGERAGSLEMMTHGDNANRFGPELRSHDRFGRRIDQVDFHPSYHELMKFAKAEGICAGPYDGQGSHQQHAAMVYLLTQAEPGVCCPLVMTYAAIPTLRRHAPRSPYLRGLLSREYDQRFVPMAAKSGLTAGMAMTEKQGGSDVRANSTRAVRDGEAYLLTGHKWFCSAPMSDVFLTLAQTDAGLSCFLVPRFRPDGSQNAIYIQRLKDKLGNRANASSEVEYNETYAELVGVEGSGVRTILEMVQHTRLSAATAPVGMMRMALRLAKTHCAARSAFGKRLSEQPLMQAVLGDLELEVRGCASLVLRVARAFDAAERDPAEAALARLGTAVAKYWTNKRAPEHVYECMECHGGSGYVEESMLPRLYREAPVNSIWEGSGNVIALDVIRALRKDEECVEALKLELAKIGLPLPSRLQRVVQGGLEQEARILTEELAVALATAALSEVDPNCADAYRDSRVLAHRGASYGTLAMTQSQLTELAQ